MFRICNLIQKAEDHPLYLPKFFNRIFHICKQKRMILEKETRMRQGSQIQTNSLFSTDHPRELKKGLIPIGETWIGLQGKEIPLRRERREEGDPAPTVCQGIEETMARPDEKEEEKIAKPAARKKRLVPEKKNHQQEANDQAQERGVKESTVAKCRGIPEVI